MLCIRALAAQAPPSTLTLQDLDGRAVAPFQEGGRGFIFVFARADCPIANRYAPELERIRRRAAATSIDMWLVFVEPGAHPAALARHLRDHDYEGAALVDPAHRLVALSGATTTPEAAVFAGSPPRLIYRGRIDDWYESPGRRRRKPSSHDLDAIIAALASGHIPPFRETTAVGCTIADLRP